MNRLGRVVACSIIVALPALAFAQSSTGQMPRGGMMNQEQMQQMNENMARMQEMMQAMRSTNSNAERQRLQEQHMEYMQEHMQMMRGGMMGPGMMGNNHGMLNNQGMMNNQGQKQPGNAKGNRSGGPGMDDDQRLELMENRMNQMQLMMEQMLQHQRQLNRN